MAKNHEYHDETEHGLTGSLSHWLIFHALPCRIEKKTIPSAPAAKSLEGSEECKLAYHQKLLSKNDVSPLCTIDVIKNGPVLKWKLRYIYTVNK